jgi:hypothetical protein
MSGDRDRSTPTPGLTPGHRSDDHETVTSTGVDGEGGDGIRIGPRAIVATSIRHLASSRQGRAWYDPPAEACRTALAQLP